MKLEALIRGFVYTAGQPQSKELLEGLRQELGLKGQSSLAQHCRGRCARECPACEEDLGVILTHHKFSPVGHHWARRELQKRFNVLNSGMSPTDRQYLAPTGSRLLLGTNCPAL